MPNRNLILALFLSIFLLIGVYSARFFYKFSNQNPIDIDSLTGLYDPNETSAVFNNEIIPAPTDDLAQVDISAQKVLGDDDGSDKRIEVDLTNQKVYAYEGDKKVMDFLVSTGKWGKTPTGEFRIWTKLRYTKMSGGSKALHTYYYLPNVPFVMFFSNSEVPASKGFSLHGTYWHSNFGHPMSHGCVNMKTEEVEQLYYWAHPKLGDGQSIRATKDNPGTKIIIYGEAPNE